ncbi:hypothetical protein [Halalkalibacter krulwichiae]|uniref:ABC-2 family transporter protein n=1 Tax=Halalkalibacter krulwichiae TaxID=199441 RepID=A0A1X9MAD1_9BACI|nr:hypothetical protein [Halalkalibacter krulwichiae]ARK30419.1 hypothetical protein BkAM31D_11615 [Halalkalibacter krulwichiae]
MWMQTWWLVKKEMINKAGSIFLTALFVMLVGVITATMLGQFIEGQRSNQFLLDLIFIGITPSFAALVMSGPYLTFQTIKTDPFTKVMGFYRSLAIPFRVLVLSRTVFMLFTLVAMSAVYYLTIFLRLQVSFIALFEVSNYLMFALFWFGYALALGGINSFIEYGTSGKMLYIFSFVMTISVVAFVLLFSLTFHVGFVELSIRLLEQYQWYAVCLSLVLGCLGFTLWYKLLYIRLGTRDYV